MYRGLWRCRFAHRVVKPTTKKEETKETKETEEEEEKEEEEEEETTALRSRVQ